MLASYIRLNSVVNDLVTVVTCIACKDDVPLLD
jgi:hypothetical protein